MPSSRSTGERLTDFETRYWERRTFVDRWIPVISSSVLLWGGIALLALAAIRRRRARDAARLARWGVEEGEVASPFGELFEGELDVEAEIDDGLPPPPRPMTGRRASRIPSSGAAGDPAPCPRNGRYSPDGTLASSSVSQF